MNDTEAREAAWMELCKRYGNETGVIGPIYRQDFEFVYDAGYASVPTEEPGLREALKHYAKQCDSCSHPIHDGGCGVLVSLGWTKGLCECRITSNVARAALSKSEGSNA